MGETVQGVAKLAPKTQFPLLSPPPPPHFLQNMRFAIFLL